MAPPADGGLDTGGATWRIQAEDYPRAIVLDYWELDLRQEVE